MADNANHKKINDTLNLLKKQVGDLYTSTYFTQDNSDELKNQVSDKLDDAIRKSTLGDNEFKNISNTSKLFRKLLKSDGGSSNNASIKLNKSFGTGGADDISTLFKDPNIMASLMDTYAKTKWITELDNEFDLICKYMTKLQTALDIKRDAVLCSDSYNKEFLTVKAIGENRASDANIAIQNNISEMIKKYNLSDKVEQWYEDTSKYGEEFVYCVPYSVALEELLKRKKNTNYSVTNEAVTFGDLKDVIPKDLKGSAYCQLNQNNEAVINIKLDTSKVIYEAVENNLFLRKAIGDNKLKGLSESFIINETNSKFEDHIKKTGKDTEFKFDVTIGDELEYEDDDATASNGLVKLDDNKTKLKVNGAILRTIKHDRIIPIYIEDVLFGAYYIRYNQFLDVDINSSGGFKGYNSITGMFNNGSVSSQMTSSEDEINQKDMLLRSIAGQISQKIDKAFINSNTDLKKEIYLMLRFNDKYNRVSGLTQDMDIVFIPADDIHHMKFREDPDTHRGISDLWDSLVPAKQWITLTLTSVIGITTRGYDRRMYYVKQSLDTNTAQSLLNVIATIKKGNFGMRQMESVNNILGIVGRFNDFVIPVGQDGTPPIQFETQQGQQFESPTELLTNLEESAVNSTGVPLEIVNSAFNADFASRYTMTNAKLLRNVLKRQLKVEDFASKIFTKIYRFEYDDNVELEVILPPPAFLSMTQGSQLLSSATQYAEAITEVEMSGQPDEAKQLFKKRLVRKLIPAYLSDEEIESIKERISIDNAIEKSKGEEDY